MMFPTAVKGHIPFAPTYSERKDKQKLERRRRATSSSSADEYLAKRKSMGSGKQSKVSGYSSSQTCHGTKRSARDPLFGELESCSGDRFLKLSFPDDSQIAVSLDTFRKTNDLSTLASPGDQGRKRSTFLKSFINLFRRRTRLSIDMHTAGNRDDLETTGTVVGLRLTEVTECGCECAGSASSHSKRPSSARRRRNLNLRLESILEEDDETEEDEDEDDIESDSAIDVGELDGNDHERS